VEHIHHPNPLQGADPLSPYPIYPFCGRRPAILSAFLAAGERPRNGAGIGARAPRGSLLHAPAPGPGPASRPATTRSTATATAPESTVPNRLRAVAPTRLTGQHTMVTCRPPDPQFRARLPKKLGEILSMFRQDLCPKIRKIPRRCISDSANLRHPVS